MQPLGTIRQSDQLAALADEHCLAILHRLMCDPSTIPRPFRDFDRQPAYICHHAKHLEVVNPMKDADEWTARDRAGESRRADAGFDVDLLQGAAPHPATPPGGDAAR